VKRLDRRTFLKNGLRTGAVVVGAGSIGYAEWTVLQEPPSSSNVTGSAPGTPVALTVNGDPSPIGVDPDDLYFAWQVLDPRRGAIQSAYRLTVSRADPGPGGSKKTWDSGLVSSGLQAFVPYTGPALAADSDYRLVVTTRGVNGDIGPLSAPANFVTGLRDGDWSAQWLRPGPPDTGLERYTYLRKTFELPAGKISRATVFAGGAHKYQLWINGSKLDTGPSFCYPDEQYVQATDVTKALSSGKKNVVGFLHHWYSAGKGRPTSAPGLLAQLSVHYANGTKIVVGTDESWVERAAEWLPAAQRNTDAGDFVEIIDARSTPLGWSTAGYNDSGWEPVTVLGRVGTSPFTHLYAQRTRIVETVVKPVSVTTLENGAVVADFGKVYAARPNVSFREGLAGRMIPMHVGYVTDPDGHVSTIHATQATNLAFSYIERDGSQIFDPYTYLGFRYLEIDDPGEQIDTSQVTALVRHCVLPSISAATFTSSDPMLDSVWDLCARSGLYVTHEQFVDTPTREKGQFLWDSCSESQVIMRVHTDFNLTWQALRDFARSQARYWPDGRVSDIYPTGYGAQSYVNFTALYPEWVWRYYLSSGDLATLKSLYPVLQRVAGYLYKPVDPSTGLVTGVPLYPSADSNYGYNFDTHCDASINILTANALQKVGLVAGAVGDQSGQQLWQSRSTSVAAAVNKWIARPDGIYTDGLRSDRTRSPNASQLANIQALSYGIVPAAKAETVGKYVASLGISVEPSDGMELVRALHNAGLDSDIVRILTDTSNPGYGWILTHGGTFCWEAWELSDLIGDSMSHGWGSSALVGVQEAILGFVPVVPSEGEPPTMLDIKPAFGALDSASGNVPTVAGPASITWNHASGDIHMRLTLPPNSQGLLHLPANSASQVSVDTTPVTKTDGIDVVSATAGILTLRVGAGTYAFEISGT
jgi:alpha-L-rhamnosidase